MAEDRLNAGAALFALLAAQAAPYFARGSDPSWSLEISDRQVRFQAPGGRVIMADRRTTTENEVSRRYEADGLSVEVMAGGCTDPVTGRRYADAVFVTFGQRELEGCGGAEHAADALDYTSWHLMEIGGESVPLTGDLLRDDLYAVDFGPGAIVGYGGCNRIGATFARTGDMITFGPFSSTRRLCSEPVMRRERRLLEILGGPVRISLADPSTVVLTGEAGSIKLRRSAED